MTISRQKEVSAVLGEEFNQLIDQLGIREEFADGKYRCKNCQQSISWDNVLLIFPLPKREVGFLCRNPECVVEYAVAS